MRRFALCAALLCAAPSYANTMIAKQGDDWVRVTDKPCTDKRVLSRLAPGAGKQFMAATSGIAGAPYVACWTPYGDSALLIYEDGDKGLIPMSDFKEDAGV